MPKQQKVLYVRMSPKLHRALERLAKSEKRSLTNQAEWVLEKYAREQLGEEFDAPAPAADEEAESEAEQELKAA